MAIVCAFRVTYWRFLPHLLLILVHTCFSFQYFITEAAFNHGLNPHIYVTYRYIVGSLVIFPFAYFLERKLRPKLTVALFLEIFVLSLLGASLPNNMYFASLRYTSPTFVTSVVNSIPCMTFITAIVLRLEVVDVRNPCGIAKILGSLISLAGAMVITLYKGPEVPILQGAPIHIRSSPVKKNWMKGSFLTGASCITWSSWFIMQAYTLKRYPAQLSLTAWINCIGAAQSAVFTVFIQHKPAAWSISFNIEFWSIIYAGVTSCCLAVFIQLWCTKQKGPVFVTMFSPLSAIMTAILAYFLFGEKLHMGSVLGGATVIIGLYLLLWGKEGDQDQNKPQEQSLPPHDEYKVPQIQTESVAGREAVNREL